MDSVRKRLYELEIGKVQPKPKVKKSKTRREKQHDNWAIKKPSATVKKRKIPGQAQTAEELRTWWRERTLKRNSIARDRRLYTVNLAEDLHRKGKK